MRNRRKDGILLYEANDVHEQIYQKHNESISRDQDKKQSKKFFDWLNLLTKDDSLQDIDDEEDYWKFYRKKTGKFSLKILFVNFIVLLVTVIFISKSNIFGDEGLGQKNALIVWVMIWAFVTLICLFFFLLYFILPTDSKRWDVNANNVWDTIAWMIIYGKVLIVVRTISNSVIFSDFCYGISGTSESSLIGVYVFLQTLVDLYQAFIFSMLPFRWPFTIYFCGIQFIEVVIRIYSCRDGLDIPLRHKLVPIFIGKIASYFLNSVVIISYHRERSLKNMYTNLQTQQKAAQENIRFVNLLCRDLKLTTLKYNHSLSRFISLLNVRNGYSYEFLSESVESLTGMIDATNIIIDDVVFIIKVIEKRFNFTLLDDFEVFPLFIQSLSGCLGEEKEKLSEILSLIDIQISRYLKIKSNKMCFRVLSFYTLILVKEIIEKRKENQMLYPENKFLIRCEIVADPELNVKETSDSDISFLRFSIEWKGEINLAVTGESNSMLNSACLICNTITNSYGKSYTFTSRCIEFLFPFKTSTLVLFNPLLNLAPDHPDNVKFKQFIIAEICLLISDNHMETLAKDVINHLPGGREIVVIRELQSAAIFAHSIILVQSEMVAKQLREKGFSGKVVLLSEKLSYFSELDLKTIDYGIQLPQMIESANEFQIFLYQNYLQSQSILSGKFISLQAPEQPTVIFGRTEFTISNFRESFYLWKYISNRAFDSPLDVIVLASILYLCFLVVMRVVGILAFMVSVSTFSFLIFRSAFYRLIQKCQKVSFVSIYKIFVLVTVLGIIQNSLQDFFQLTRENGRIVVKLTWRNHYDSFEEYLLTKPDITPSGLMIFTYLMGNVDCLRYFGEALPPASCHFLVFFIAIRFCSLVSIYGYVGFISWEIAGAAMMFYGFYLTAFFLCHYEQGGLVQRDFLLLNERLISTDMFERCSFVSKQLLLPRLELFNQAEDRLLEKIADLTKKETLMSDLVALAEESVFDQKCINNRILLLSPEMVRQIQRLQHYRRLALSLRFSLKTVETRFFPSTESKSVEEKKMELMIDVKAHMLRNVVEEVIQSFIHGGYETVIRYYVVIHPSVAMIRINKDLFTTTLIDLIQQSMSRIEKNFEDLPYLQKVDHQVLIWIQPTRVEDRIIPFSEVRELQMTVLDTGMVKMRRGGELFEGFEMRVEKGETGSSIFFNEYFQGKHSSSSKGWSREDDIPGTQNTSTKTLFSGYHKLSDQFLELFGLPDRSEMGMLYHQQYKSFQKVAFPVLPCTISNQVEPVLKERKEYSKVMKIDPQNLRVYYRYSVEQAEDILSIFAELSQVGIPKVPDASSTAEIRDLMKSRDISETQKLKLNKDQLSEIKIVEKHYKKFWDQSLTLLSLSLPQNKKTKISGSQPVETPQLQKGCVTVYSVAGEETSRRSHWLHHMFQKHRIVFRFGELESYPKRSFHGSDIIILEYSPRFVKHKISKTDEKRARIGRDYYYRLEMPYNIRNVIHYLRAVGFMGMIVIVHQDPKNKMDGKKLDSFVEGNDETDDFYESNLRNPNAYSDAAKADLQLTLPWNESIVDEIITHWKKKRFSDLFFHKQTH